MIGNKPRFGRITTVQIKEPRRDIDPTMKEEHEGGSSGSKTSGGGTKDARKSYEWSPAAFNPIFFVF